MCLGWCIVECFFAVFIGDCRWLSGELDDAATAVLCAVPSQSGSHDGVVVGAGWRAVAPGAAGQAFQGIICQFGEQDWVVEQGYGPPFDGEGEGFDERGLGFGGGVEGSYGQAFLQEGFDIRFADAIGFRPDDLWPPMLNKGFEPVALEVPADLIKAVEGGHSGVGDVDNGDGGVVIIASPIDAGDVGMAWLGMVELFGDDCVGDAAEDLSAVVGEMGLVFGLPDVFRCELLDVVQFGGLDEGVVGAGKVEGLPFGLSGIVAEAKEVAEPIASFGRAQKQGVAAGGGEHGTDDFGPEAGVHESGFVEHGEIETFATQVVGMVGATNGDHAATGEVNAAFGFADAGSFQCLDSALQVSPDLTRHLSGRRQPPAAFVLVQGRVENAGHPQFRFAPAAAAGDHFEPRGVFHHLRLPRVEDLELYRRSNIRI